MPKTFSMSAATSAAKPVLAAAAALAVVALSGCGIFDRSRTGPNEFDVVTYAPLSLPPDFGLRPPESEAEERPGNDPRDQARGALTTGSTTDSASAAGGNIPVLPGAGLPESKGEKALLEKAGALSTEPGIRSAVDHESGRVVVQPSLVDRLISPITGKDVTPRTERRPGVVIDPDVEAERLKQEGTSLGKPATKRP